MLSTAIVCIVALLSQSHNAAVSALYLPLLRFASEPEVSKHRPRIFAFLDDARVEHVPAEV